MVAAVVRIELTDDATTSRVTLRWRALARTAGGSMKRGVQISALSLALVIAVTAPLSTVASAAAPIKAGQHFLGLVNGKHEAPVVETVCPGPGGPDRFGPVEGKQTMSVVHIRKGGGDTGLFSSVYSWFQPVAGGVRPIQLRFKSYGTKRLIPKSVRVPCGGTGTVVFSSCPYLAPCAVGWVTDDVKVTFEDIAA
jgi:hypothetical protein